MRIIDMDVVLPGVSRPRLLLVKLTAENGLIGLAEALLPPSPGPLLATLDALKKSHILGLDADRPARVSHYLLSQHADSPDAIFAIAIALLEMACWDLAAKSLNVPLHRLFGGAIRELVPACVSDWEPDESSSESTSEATRRVSGCGYKIFRFDPFLGFEGELRRSDLGQSIRSCEAVRAAVGSDGELWIDLGGRFIPSDVIKLSKALERVEPAGLLDPLAPRHSHSLLAVSRRVGVPLAIGASIHHWSTVREAIVQGAIRLVQIDISTCCGFTTTRTLAALAETHGLEVALRTRGGPISESHAIQLGSILPNLRFVEIAPRSENSTLIQPGLVYDGNFAISNAIGHGIKENGLNAFHDVDSK